MPRQWTKSGRRGLFVEFPKKREGPDKVSEKVPTKAEPVEPRLKSEITDSPSSGSGKRTSNIELNVGSWTLSVGSFRCLPMNRASSPCPSPSGGEGVRRTGEEAAQFMVPLHVGKTWSLLLNLPGGAGIPAGVFPIRSTRRQGCRRSQIHGFNSRQNFEVLPLLELKRRRVRISLRENTGDYGAAFSLRTVCLPWARPVSSLPIGP